jgi:hypothetical protein
VKKIYALLTMAILCSVTSMPLLVQAQSETALQHRAEISYPVKFDKTTKPLREMFDTGERPEPARGGKDFEPGRPVPVSNRITPFTDPLADKSVGLTSALAEIKASTVGTPVDPNARVAPPDTTGDVGPNHYVQWVNLRYSIYTLTRDASNQITGFNLVPGFPKATWYGRDLAVVASQTTTVIRLFNTISWPTVGS